MIYKKYLGASIASFLSSPVVAQWNTTNPTSKNSSRFDPLQYVNQLIGTDNGGNVFAGATLPYGMAKAVADVDGQNTAGFSTDGSNVTGFSHMHDSGTGGNPSMGNFPLFPQYCPDDVIDNCRFLITDRATPYVLDSVVTTPGYFGLSLVNGINAEMSVSEHAALYQFKFPAQTSSTGTALSPLILLDLTDLNASRQNATISIADDGRIKANGTFIPSFGSGSFMSYVCVDFSGASILDTGIWVNNRAGTEPKELFVTRGINLFYIQAGGFVRFDTPTNGIVSARVGVSLVSSDKACQNAENEIPDWDFAGLKKIAEGVWREKLSIVTVETGNSSDTSLLTNFYSAIYRTMISPQNYTGENPLWESTEPYFDSFYCIWDAFRSQLPFLTIIDPFSLSEMIRSLLDTYKHIGWLPDCRMSLYWQLAYEAVVNDAENEPLDWSNEGRGGLMSWKALDYIPYLDYDYLGFGTNSRSISRTLEYSYNDFFTLPAPPLSAARAHFYIPSHFNASTTGLPGNDDTGAMASFAAFSMMGLFPNPGQNESGVGWRIGEYLCAKCVVDGVRWNKSWIGHEFFTEGKTLELVLGDTESDWGHKKRIYRLV
ncbi:hypothetical protein DID88_008327 [Monilinia fructigena]|uniref:Glycosyl hydrolase family 92 domain-containing protein n=1 Tax=Monilinia fructigena TaxID=38457 RepID=A0A395J505_9HELO|nr:hypothetical protein DID88_008327 [Monilinia fructigena]